MLKVAYYSKTAELLIDGLRQDYESLVSAVDQALEFGKNRPVALSVESCGDDHLERLLVRAGKRPNRISLEDGDIVVSVSPELREQFVSFITFPADEDLPNSPITYHHHYDNLGDDEGKYVALDSLPVVFSLLKT